MICSITGTGFSEGAANQNNASAASKAKHNGPKLTVSAGSLSFGSVAVNTATTQSLTLTSSGASAVTVSSATVTGAGFSIAQSFPVTLNPGQSLNLAVQFDPTTAGSASGQLTINSDSSTGSTAVVSLAGTATAAANPQLTISATSLTFPSVTVNTATTQSLTLTSSGTSAVTVSSATINGAGFSIVAQSFPVTLNSGQSLTLVVQFDPTTAGNASGQLTINSNSSTGSTTVVSLAGTATASNPQLTISATSLTFPSVVIGTATTLPLTLTSSGTSAVTVNSATINGAGFSVVGGNFPVTLNPTQTLALQVQFDPTVTGNASGQLTITSNSSSGSSAVVTLSGSGTAHEVDLSWVAPASSPEPVAGYNVYRSTSNGSLALVNTSVVGAPSYVDSTVASGSNYSYEVRSVDSSGVESISSNQITVTVP